MATQGLLTITNNGKTKCKIITGSDGYYIHDLAEWVRANLSHTNEELWSKAKTLFGLDSLVMQLAPDKVLYEGPCEHPEPKGDCLYFTKFQDPKFNPRWSLGISDNFEVIEIKPL